MPRCGNVRGVAPASTRRARSARVVEAAHRAGFADVREAHNPVFAFVPGEGIRLTDLNEVPDANPVSPHDWGRRRPRVRLNRASGLG